MLPERARKRSERYDAGPGGTATRVERTSPRRWTSWHANAEGRQREVLETAHEVGFSGVPRQASTEDVAGELDPGAATISDHRQRAERNLLTREVLA